VLFALAAISPEPVPVIARWTCCNCAVARASNAKPSGFRHGFNGSLASRPRSGRWRVAAPSPVLFWGYGGAAVGRAEPGDGRKFGTGDADAYTALGELRARSLTAARALKGRPPRRRK
jgi:hypothetical protein